MTILETLVGVVVWINLRRCTNRVEYSKKRLEIRVLYPRSNCLHRMCSWRITLYNDTTKEMGLRPYCSLFWKAFSSYGHALWQDPIQGRLVLFLAYKLGLACCIPSLLCCSDCILHDCQHHYLSSGVIQIPIQF